MPVLSKDDQLIDEMQEIRRKNNINWMDLVRLAFKLDPVRAKSIMLEVIENDELVIDILRKLSE